MSIFTANLATLAATTANPLLWYVTRTAAVCAYVTLTATVILGLARSLARVGRVRDSRTLWLLDELHPYLALLTAAFIALHLLSLLFDPLIPFAPLNLLVPVAEPYRPFAVGVGIFALYTMAVVLLSSWLRRYIKHAHWRALHYTSFIAFVLVSLHGLLAGSDGGEPWMQLVYIGGAGVVTALVLIRIFWPSQPAQPQRRGTAVVVPASVQRRRAAR